MSLQLRSAIPALSSRLVLLLAISIIRIHCTVLAFVARRLTQTLFYAFHQDSSFGTMEIAAYVRVACAQVDLIGLLAQQSQPAAPASLGAWACSACTYENPSAKLGVCDVCGAERRADCDGGGGGGGGAGSVRGAIVSALEASDVWAHVLNSRCMCHRVRSVLTVITIVVRTVTMSSCIVVAVPCMRSHNACWPPAWCLCEPVLVTETACRSWR